VFSKEGSALFYFALASAFFGLLGAAVIAAGVALVTWWSNDDAYKPITYPLEDLSGVLAPEESPEPANDKPVVRLVRKGFVNTGSEFPNLGKPYQNLAGRQVLSSNASSKRQEGGGSVPAPQGGQMSGRAGGPVNKPGSAPPAPAAKEAAPAPAATPAAAATPAPTTPPAPAKGVAPEGPVPTATAALPGPERKPTATLTSPASTPTVPVAPPEPPTPRAGPPIMRAEPPPLRDADDHNAPRAPDNHRGGVRGR
jgi:hypothetical protein